MQVQAKIHRRVDMKKRNLKKKMKTQMKKEFKGEIGRFIRWQMGSKTKSTSDTKSSFKGKEIQVRKSLTIVGHGVHYEHEMIDPDNCEEEKGSQNIEEEGDEEYPPQRNFFIRQADGQQAAFYRANGEIQ